jgi:hypothetical protein
MILSGQGNQKAEESSKMIDSLSLVEEEEEEEKDLFSQLA